MPEKGKNLIGNSLSYTISSIMCGECSVDDIRMIYSGTCFEENEQSISDLMEHYAYIWERALDNETSFKKIMNRTEEESKALHEKAITKAREIFDALHNSGKIVQTRYRIPEGQESISIIDVDEKGNIGGEHTTSSIYGEFTQINGTLYNFGYKAQTLGIGSSGLFNNELELIANQLPHSHNTDLHSGVFVPRRVTFMKLMFPQYADAIDKVSHELDERKMQSKGEYMWASESDILSELNNIVNQEQQHVHTSSEIAEATSNIPMSLVEDALDTVVKDSEKSKEETPSIGE